MELPPEPDEQPQVPRAPRSPARRVGKPTRRVRPTTVLVLAVIAVGAYVVIGGGGGGKDEVNQAAERFIEAANDGDFETVCGLLSADYRTELDALGGKCDRFLGSRGEGKSTESTTEIDQVRVREDRATVDLIVRRPGRPSSDQQLQLEKTKDGWRIFNIE